MNETTISLESLKAARAAKRGELASIEDARVRLTSAENDEAAIIAEIAALSREEVAAAQAWAKANDGSPFPEPNAKRRGDLNKRLAQAQLNAETVKAVALDLNQEQGRVAGEIAEIEASINAMAIEVLKAEHAKAVEKLRALAVQVQAQAAYVAAFRQFLTAEGQRHQSAGRNDQAMICFRQNEALGGYEPIEFSASPGAILQSTSTWSARFNQLKA